MAAVALRYGRIRSISDWQCACLNDTQHLIFILPRRDFLAWFSCRVQQLLDGRFHWPWQFAMQVLSSSKDSIIVARWSWRYWSSEDAAALLLMDHSMLLRLGSVVIICLLMMMLSVGPALKPDAKGWTMLYYSTRPSLSSIVSCFWQRSTKEIGCLSQTQANHGPRPPGRSGYLDTSDLATSDLAISPIIVQRMLWETNRYRSVHGFWPWKSACSRGHDGHLGLDLHLALQCMDLKITCLRTSQTRSDIEVIL